MNDEKAGPGPSCMSLPPPPPPPGKEGLASRDAIAAAATVATTTTTTTRSGAEKGKRTDGRTPFYVIIHNVAKKTNIGAMIRSASAFDCESCSSHDGLCDMESREKGEKRCGLYDEPSTHQTHVHSPRCWHLCRRSEEGHIVFWIVWDAKACSHLVLLLSCRCARGWSCLPCFCGFTLLSHFPR